MGLVSPQVKVDLSEITLAAVNSVIPGDNLAAYMPERPKGRVVIIGAGKASAKMAAAVDKIWSDVDLTGVVSTRYGHGVDAGRIKIVEAGHPIPDENSQIAAQQMIDVVSNLAEEDLVIALISGGGSACCALPINGVSLAQKQALTKALLHNGATISEINTVRKSLSKIKGGKLALAALPARVHSLIISDIPGDNPSDVASGPTVLSDSLQYNAVTILHKYGLGTELIAALEGQEAQIPVQASNYITHDLVATPIKALEVAAKKAADLGYTPLVLSDEFEGESAQLGKMMAAIAKSVKKHQQPVRLPAAIISGGETTVSIGDVKPGKGGRNTEFLLAFAVELQGLQGVYALAVDSDGIDGSEDAAGAVVTPESLMKAAEVGVKATQYLERHDSYSFFEAIDDLVITGPTLTNVNDIRVVIIV